MTTNAPVWRRASGMFIVGLMIAGGAVALPTSDASAKKVTDRVKVACSGDYKRFCKRYKVGTTKLRQCMRSNGKRLSRVCVEALVDAGEVSRRVLRNRR